MAAKIAQCSVYVSIEIGLENSVVSFLYENKEAFLTSKDILVREDEEAFVKVFKAVEKIFFSASHAVSNFVYEKAALDAKCVVVTAPLMQGRIELLHYFGEQSISHSYHRYGNLGARGIKKG